MSVTLLALTAAILTCGIAAAAEGSFYKGLPLFSTRPNEKRSVSSIDRFGPVGMGIELHQPAFVMKIKNIEEGSPAEAAGKLKKGQIIETINGQKLADIDPRIQLARIMGEAEATDGVLKFVVKEKPDGKAEEVIVRIPVLGAYSKTWPLNCAKSDKIVRDLADHLAKRPWEGGVALNGMQMLFMLSTGEEKDLAVVREWIKKTVAHYEKNPVSKYAWFVGYGGIPLAEYYLRTGDKSILPVLKKFADVAKRTQYLGGWAGRGGVPWLYVGGGHLNAAGTNVVTFLLLAKECGVDVDEHTLQSALKQFYRFAGRGNNPYGDHRPETGFVDNGKVGALAFAMAAAASLTPDGENSVYARARDVSAVKGFYSTSWMLHGHTGGGIGEIWRSAAMGLMYDKNPKKYREFMDNRMWFYELSRRHDGSFGILGGARYDTPRPWGVGLALSYTVPRKTLRITGAPKNQHVHEYQLPERPWGTKADDKFLSLEAAVDKDGKSPAIDEETLENGSAAPILRRINAEDVSEETLRSYAHHQDHGIRRAASMRAAGQGMNYLGWNVSKSGKALYPRLVVELLKSKDPRVRWAGANAVNTLPQELLTDETFDLLMGMINDPHESWWVKHEALQVLGKASPEWIAPHVDTLPHYLKHEEWWLRNSAIMALTPVATDERYYKKILPALGEVITTNQRANVLGPVNGIVRKLGDASPKVQKAAAEMLGQAYTDYPEAKRAPGGQDLEAAFDAHLENIARVLSETPGGFDLLFELSAKRFPERTLPHSKFYMANPDPDKFGARVRKALTPIIMEKMIPEYIGKNRVALLAEASGEKQRRVEGSAFPQGKLDGLTDLYRKAGVDDYNWRPFGPDLQNMEWGYHTFEPKEQAHWDALISRFRKVTYPAGMENWFAVDFDAGKAGWKKGLPPFGQLNGKLHNPGGPCRHPTCPCGEPMRTLWDKEVLLVRGAFEFPPLKEGYRYRVRVGSGEHVGKGDGYAIYINGKQLIEYPRCPGRGQGAKPRGAFISKEFTKDFQGGKVVIAATSFLRFNRRYKVRPTSRVPQGRFSLWLEEMKIPPLGQAEMVRSATVLPMLSMRWQAKQDPDNKESQTEDDRFRYDGRFVANPMLLGSWKTIDQIKTIDEFNLEKRMKPGRAHIREMTFKDKGETGEMLWIWSGDVLMDLTRNQALKMTVKTIDGTDYLFIEAGGFSTRHPKGWKPPLYVMKRAGK